MKMLQTDYQVSGRPGTNPEIRQVASYDLGFVVITVLISFI